MEQTADSPRPRAYLIAGGILPLHVLANPMVKLVFLRQIYSTAIRSLRLISVVALVIGAAFVKHLTEILGADSRMFELVELVLLHNSAPLAAAVIVIGRSATAISTELALMRCSGEIETLRNLRIPVYEYVVIPRVAAVMLATVGCCFYSQLIAVTGGFAVSSLMLDVSLGDQLYRFAEYVSIGGIVLDVVKSLCFGFVIAIVACAVGLNATWRMTEVQFAPAQAFLRALLAVIAVNVLFIFFLH
jgi:phospholipid/cholesterol/gamma-HCH transport system permease protein